MTSEAVEAPSLRSRPSTERSVDRVVHGRLNWWRLLRLLNEQRPRWDEHYRVGHAVTALTHAGRATVLAYLQHRATGPRHDLHG
ncbi:MAG: hypothetical protein KY460_01870 [Actinobacteria bacterium]|nr:hypothetical protein [Actinomycetota bacterium]